MTLLSALILLPFAMAVQISLVIALAKAFDGDAQDAGTADVVPTLA